MQIQWLQAFLTVAKLKNFSNAAEELFISQSSLSKQIQNLEKELDVRLFDRTTRSLELTPIGYKLLSDTANITDSYEQILKTVKNFKHQQNNSIRLACTPVLHLYGLSDHLYNFAQKYPDIHLMINEGSHKNVIKALRAKDADLVITRVDEDTFYDEFRVISLYDDELVILCNSQHPFAAKKEVSLSEAIEEDIFLLQGSQENLNSVLAHYGLSLDSAHIKGTMNGFAIASILKRESALSLMVLSMAKLISAISDLKIVTLTERPPYPTRILTRKNESLPAMNTLIQYLQNTFHSEV